MIKRIVIILFVLLVGFALFFLIRAYQFAEFMEELGECGMAAGPIYGDSIRLDTKIIELEQEIVIPRGSLGFLNLSDTLAPKIIKFDDKNEILWAIEFSQDSLHDIPHQTLSEMKLNKGEAEISLSFFNNSYAEPGRIYLTTDYEFMYMCLSPM